MEQNSGIGSGVAIFEQGYILSLLSLVLWSLWPSLREGNPKKVLVMSGPRWPAAVVRNGFDRLAGDRYEFVAFDQHGGAAGDEGGDGEPGEGEFGDWEPGVSSSLLLIHIVDVGDGSSVWSHGSSLSANKEPSSGGGCATTASCISGGDDVGGLVAARATSPLGFGLVWALAELARGSLNWALAKEVGLGPLI